MRGESLYISSNFPLSFSTLHHHVTRSFSPSLPLLSQVTTATPASTITDHPSHLRHSAPHIHHPPPSLPELFLLTTSHPHREELWNERLGLKKRDLKDVVGKVVRGEQV